MSNKPRKILLQILCVLMSIVMLSSTPLNAFAVAEANKPLYVKDIQLIYAESKKEAESLVPEGYTLLSYDLNMGTEYVFDVLEVYLVYATTENPEEAITDIKMMNMNGGYVFSDYESQLKNVENDIKEVAYDVKAAVAMFAENYEAGTYGAQAAYTALNCFTVDEADGQGLGDYFLYGNPADEFYYKLILHAHQSVLSSILSALAMAVQGEKGNSWLDRLTQIEDPWLVDEQPGYWEKSEILWEHFASFYKVYNSIDHDLYRKGDPTTKPSVENDGEAGADLSDTATEPDVDNTGIEALYELAYMTLEQYSFDSGELFSEWFVGYDLCEDEYFEMLYCLLEVLTPEEYAMMRLCGPLYMILATGMDEGVLDDYLARLDEVTGGETVCSVWAGVNSELFRSSIAITDEAARAIAETEFEQSLNNDGDSSMDAVLKTAGLVAACGAVSLGVGIITYYSFGTLMLSCFSGTVLSTAAANLGVVGTIFGAVTSALGVAAIAVALVVALVYVGVWVKDWWDEHHVDYTEIPEYMYDYVEDNSGNFQYVLYEGVRFQDGKLADVNAWEGKQWHAMYISRDKAAGAPIEANFVVRYGDGRIDEGYAGLANFGQVNAENLNHYADDDEVNGIFVTYPQEDLKGDFARGTYLSDAKLFSHKDREQCAMALKNEGYVLYNVNLTPNSDYTTYLGYKTTNSASRALTDLRVAYGYTAGQYAAGGGGLTYAASGTTGDGKMTLYTTKISLFGSPILSDFLVLNDRNAPAGYEPVNHFSGGPAANWNLKDGTYIGEGEAFYIYFLPSVTYTGGTEYLGGLATAFDVPGANATNGNGSVSRASINLGYRQLSGTIGSQKAEGALLYTTTYNPYRAIYGITAVSASNEMGNYFAETILYDGIGYCIAGRYLVNHREKISFDGACKRKNDNRLYVAGVYAGGTPMQVSDLKASKTQDAPSGYTAVSARLETSDKAVDLAKAFNFKIITSNFGGNSPVSSMEVTMAPFYLFVRGSEYKQNKYLTHVFISSKEQVLNGLDMACDELDHSYVMNALASQGAHTVIDKNLNLEDSDNATYLGYSKIIGTDTNLVNPITNLVLYYAEDSKEEPQNKLEIKGVMYHLVGNVNLFCEEDGEDDKCDRVYLYYTTNPAAGSPVLDIKIDNTAIVNGWDTVRTQNGKALYDDMDAYEGSMWFIHLKRTTEDPKYISQVVVGWGSDAEAKAMLIAAGCDYMLEKDLNNNCGLHSDYVYLGYKRTSDPNQAIRDLRTTHDNEVDSFEKNGIAYTKVAGNLNSYTNLFADDIFLYYTKDAKAGTPIISLETSKDPVNTSRNGNYLVSTVVNQKNKSSDLNDGAGGDYIYLLQIRDKNDQTALASMMGNGSGFIIVAFALASLGAIVWVSVGSKKRCVLENAEARNNETRHH